MDKPNSSADRADSQEPSPIDKFLAWESRTRDTIDFKTLYVDMADDLVAGLLLSQILYWHLPDEKGRARLRVEHDGHRWLAKRREQWWDECRLKPRQVDRALAILEDRRLVVTKTYRFDGSPTKHVRIDWRGFMKTFREHVWGNPKPEVRFNESVNSNLRSRNMDLPETVNSITESTSETTSEITSFSTESSETSSLESETKETEEKAEALNAYVTRRNYQAMKAKGYKITSEEYSYHLGRADNMLSTMDPTDAELELLPDAFVRTYEIKGKTDAVMSLNELRRQEARREIIAEGAAQQNGAKREPSQAEKELWAKQRAESESVDEKLYRLAMQYEEERN